MGHELRGIAQGGKNIFAGEAGVFAQNILDAVACAQELEDGFYRDSRSPDHRLTVANIRVDLDAAFHSPEYSGARGSDSSLIAELRVYFRSLRFLLPGERAMQLQHFLHHLAHLLAAEGTAFLEVFLGLGSGMDQGQVVHQVFPRASREQVCS